MEERAARIIRARLRSVAMGILAILDSRSFSLYRTDFATLFIENPLEAYKVLVEATGGRERARVILRSLLIPLAGSPVKVLEAINALERGDGSLVRELIKRAGSREG
ncbi:hypothetical protein Hbut_0209 [Hyperthermus butylicus DSM 5456]|uniref:Uncharacterized protein n=2 Tax=Hyperthermus butylicus TaxID=54248 RepID=A2BJC0_HYPBU|nr:hypothetical protein Hbut_0209 [Hyperthermus butylicus DSM 5456]